MSDSNKPHPLTTSKLEFLTSDEGLFAVLFIGVALAYTQGFPHLATIIAVYDSIFAFSGMLKYREGSSGSDDVEEEIGEMMSQAGEMMEELQDEEDIDG